MLGKFNKAVLLTLAPPLVGLSSFYRSIYDFELAELSGLIFRQLWYVNFEWLCVAFLLNLYIVYRRP